MAFSLFIISTFFFSYVVNNVDVEQCITVLVMIDLGLGLLNKDFGFWGKFHEVPQCNWLRGDFFTIFFLPYSVDFVYGYLKSPHG